MALDDDVALLERIPVLEILGRDALRILAIGAETRRLQDGEMLFREGEDADAAYVVVSGTVLLKNVLDPTRPEFLAGPGVLLGEMALLTPIRRPATAVGRDDATLLRIPRNTFLRTLEGYPNAATALRRMLAQRVTDTTVELGKIRRRLDGLDRAPQPPEWA